MVPMEALVRRTGYPWGAHARKLVAPIVVWAVWGAMTAATILFIRQYARNIPYMDDFALVPLITGHDPVSLQWIWSQHNEHRPAISRLILVGLHRFIANDFRVGMYFNAGLLSAAAASTLLLVRRLRGSFSITDIVLPLSILNLGQAETLLISFAMNLMLTAWISCELIATAASANDRLGWRLALKFGLFLVLLPLCGGSGLVMLPPLAMWLAGYSACGLWSGRDPGVAARAIGLWLLTACSVVVGLYLIGYTSPAHRGPPPSLTAVATTTLEYLSLVVCADAPNYWRLAGLTVVLLVGATLLRLVVVVLQHPEESPSALGLIALILSMLSAAAAVGLSRSYFGAVGGRASRYVTIAAPLLCAVYVAWLAHGPSLAQRVVHNVLLALVCLAMPANIKFGLRFGEDRLSAYRSVERSLKARAHRSVLMRKACPALFPDPEIAYKCFKMLKDARVGDFANLVDDRVVDDPETPTAVH
jgi:hypothetical protein